jgi:hypothetical protein
MATRTITDQFPLPAATAIREIRELVGDGPRLAVDHSGALTHPRVAVHVAAAELGRALVLDVAVVGVHAFAGEGGSEERREGEEKATEVKGLHCGWVAYRFVDLECGGVGAGTNGSFVWQELSGADVKQTGPISSVITCQIWL